jgi:predicted XRE-type DNA-binding protein
MYYVDYTCLHREVHARQAAELARRNAEIELRGTQTTIQQLKRRAGDLKLQLTREQESYMLKEEAYAEELKILQELQFETKKMVEQRALTQNDLKSSTDTCQELQQLLNVSQTELRAAQQQGETDRRKYTEHMGAVENEIESLRERLKEKEDMAVSDCCCLC